MQVNVVSTTSSPIAGPTPATGDAASPECDQWESDEDELPDVSLSPGKTFTAVEPKSNATAKRAPKSLSKKPSVRPKKKPKTANRFV